MEAVMIVQKTVDAKLLFGPLKDYAQLTKRSW